VQKNKDARKPSFHWESNQGVQNRHDKTKKIKQRGNIKVETPWPKGEKTDSSAVRFYLGVVAPLM